MTTLGVFTTISAFVGLGLRQPRIFSRVLRPLICIPLIINQGCAGIGSNVERVTNDSGNALLCRPLGKGPFPAVIYSHGIIVDQYGYSGALKRGLHMAAICEALARDGFLAYAPIRASNVDDIPGHALEVSRAIDFVKTLPEADASRIALMGMSRGGLLTLMLGLQRHDLKSLVIQAPAPGRGSFNRAVRQVGRLDIPVLLVVEASDDEFILRDFNLLKEALQRHGKEARTILYDQGGGHRLFMDVGYYWTDLRAFLQATLEESAPDSTSSRSFSTGPQKAGTARKTSAPIRRADIVGPRGFTATQVITNNDQDGDALLNRREFPGMASAFARIDTDGDGLLTHEELETFWRSRGFGNGDD